LRPWWLVGRTLENDDAVALEGYSASAAASEDIVEGRGEGYGLGGGTEVDEDPDFVVIVGADIEVDAGREGAEFGMEFGIGDHPLGGVGEGVSFEVGTDVGDAAVVDLAGDGGGLVVEPA